MSTVWAVPTWRFRQASQILNFLREERCSRRALEVKLYESNRRTPVASRRWEARSDLAVVAQEIATYITEYGSIEAAIIAADER
jgi:hypothetical protein